MQNAYVIDRYGVYYDRIFCCLDSCYKFALIELKERIDQLVSEEPFPEGWDFTKDISSCLTVHKLPVDHADNHKEFVCKFVIHRDDNGNWRVRTTDKDFNDIKLGM